MSGRKTVKVQGMLEYANTQLARTDDYATMEFKAGISVMIEHLLMDAGAYNGFHFLNNDDSELGTLGYYTRCYHAK